MTARQPVNYASEGLAEKGRTQLRKVQATQPAADCGRVRQPIRILELGQSHFPRAVIHKTQAQCLKARKQAVMRVWKRERRKESERLPAISAAAAMNPDPVVMLIVSLLAAPPVTDDRISFTNRTSA
jgi:hypothetical protein